MLFCHKIDFKILFIINKKIIVSKMVPLSDGKIFNVPDFEPTKA